jgi:peptidoglycan hydrolase CwlO-like protein
MPEKPWDQTLVDFLKRTGEDLKKAGEEIRAEAQKLIDDVRDPETQQKIRDGLGNIGQWAKKSAEDAASKIEEVVKKADDAWRGRGAGKEAGAPKAKKASRPKKAAKKTAKKATKRSPKGSKR